MPKKKGSKGKKGGKKGKGKKGKGKGRRARHDELEDFINPQVVIVPPPHPSELPVERLDIHQLQQYLHENDVAFVGHEYDRGFLAHLVVQAGLPALKEMDICDARFRALARNPLFLHECYDQARLSLRCTGLSVTPDGGGLRRVLSRAGQSPSLTSLDLVPGETGGVGPAGVAELARALKDVDMANQQALEAERLAAEEASAAEKKKKKKNKGAAKPVEEAPPAAEKPKYQPCCQLEQLHLGGNAIGSEGSKALPDIVKHCPKLTSLNLLGNHLGVEGADSIARMLSQPSSITSLDLGACDLGAEGALAVIRAVSDGQAGIRSLGLYYNSIGNEGATAVAATVAQPGCGELTSLDLADNKIGQEGCIALIEALGENRSLTVLDVGYQPDTGIREALQRSLYNNLLLLERQRMTLQPEKSAKDIAYEKALAERPPPSAGSGKKSKGKGKGKKGKGKGKGKGKKKKKK